MLCVFFFLLIRRPPRSTRTDTSFPTRRSSDLLVLGGEQQAALEHIVGKGDLAIVVGYAGTGKSAMLGVAREAWEHQGYHVRGAALSGIAAENLEGGSAISSRTIASLEYQWDQGRELVTNRDGLVIDEAGMVGTRQIDRVLSAAEQAGAKVRSEGRRVGKACVSKCRSRRALEH